MRAVQHDTCQKKYSIDDNSNKEEAYCAWEEEQKRLAQDEHILSIFAFILTLDQVIHSFSSSIYAYILKQIYIYPQSSLLFLPSPCSPQITTAFSFSCISELLYVYMSKHKIFLFPFFFSSVVPYCTYWLELCIFNLLLLFSG